MFENIYQTNGAFKFNETLVVTLKKITMNDMIEFVTAYFNSILIFHENLFAVEMRKESVTLNKPCYAGFCLLELLQQLKKEVWRPGEITIYRYRYTLIKHRD